MWHTLSPLGRGKKIKIRALSRGERGDRNAVGEGVPVRRGVERRLSTITWDNTLFSAKLRKLFFQFHQRRLEHLAVARMPAGLHLLLQVRAGQQQGVPLALCGGRFRRQAFLTRFYPFYVCRFHLRFNRFAFPASGHKM